MPTTLRARGVACCALFLLLGIPSHSAAQQSLELSLVAACERGDSAQCRSVIGDNRLKIKPLVDSLLTVAIRSELSGRSDEFRRHTDIAQTLASAFHQMYGEKSLATAVSYVRGWSKLQRERKLLADSLHALGTSLRGKAETRDSALAVYQRALSFYRSLKDRRGEGTTLGSIGFVYWYKNDPDQALRYFEEGLKVRTSVDDRSLIGNSFNDIGSVYYVFRKDYPLAIQNHRQSERVRREIGDKSGLGRTLDNLALDWWDAGNLKEALRYSREAAHTHLDAGNPGRAGSSFHNAGMLLTDLGSFPDALLAFDRALDLQETLGDRKKIADVCDAKGVVYYRMGDYESAYECYQKARSIQEALGDERGVAQASYKLGVVLSGLGRSDQAFEAYRQSLAVFERLDDRAGLIYPLSNLGVLYSDVKQYASAQACLQKALALCRELQDYRNEIIDLAMLGNVFNYQAKYDSAKVCYLDALARAKQRESLDLLWPPLLGLGDLEEKRGAYEPAVAYYEEALACIERIRGGIVGEEFKISFAEKKRYVYEAIVHLLTTLHQHQPQAGYDARAFRVAESGKARAFLDLLSESLANVRDGADTTLVAKEDSLVRQRNAARQELDRLLGDPQTNGASIADVKGRIELIERDVRRVENDLRVKNPRYADLQYPEPVSLDEVQMKLVDPRTVLLEYAVGDSSSSLWVVAKGERALYRLPERKVLKDQIDLLRSALADSGSNSLALFRSAARSLYGMVLAPAERHLKNECRLLVVPDAELNYVPFEVLLESDGQNSFKDLPYLIRTHPLVYAQSATALRTLVAHRTTSPSSPQKQLVAFGDPVFAESGETVRPAAGTSAESHSPRGQLARLPYTGEEVLGIAGKFPPGTTDIYLRSEATEERAKEKGRLARYRFIHFATHGLINERNPDLSALALSRDAGGREDGLLRSPDIFGLDLTAELVTLSACQTGLGKMARGEGLIGLTRAFMYAGAPSVVVSLWSVSDASTSLLMQAFYGTMVVGGTLKDEALRRAKLTLLEDPQHSHPFYWAPFIIVGDWEVKR